MRMNPLVTLVVATLNRPEYLRETLSSVLAQDYPNLDILVSDNGSHDETPAVAQSLIKDDPRVRFRSNRETVPIHEHFTQCLQAARGEYFILLCDDDHINPRFVSELVNVARRHRDVNVVVPANATMDENGAVIEEFAKPQGEDFDGSEVVCNWLYGRQPLWFINVVTVLMRTETMRRFGGYQGLAGGRNNDNLLFLQCAIIGRVGFALGAVFNWRVHNSYGAGSTPQQITQSSRQFLKHLQCDPSTVEALKSLPAPRRKQIINGVRILTAHELCYCIESREGAFSWECLRQMFMYRHDAIFCYVVLRRYGHKLRKLMRQQGKHSPASA
jgi:glycosyltransferase involved in cell wall biosynthesis